MPVPGRSARRPAVPDPALPPGSAVVAYCRDSGGEAQERSVPQQRQAVEAYCERHGLALVRMFCDEATPGGSADREAFQEMIRWLRSLAPEPERGQRDPAAPEGVLYWDLRRFGRNQDDSAYFRADLRRRGYELVSLSDNIPAGDLAPVVEAMLAWKAEQDLRELSKDVRRGLYDFMLTRGENGDYLHCWTGHRPLGFRIERVMVGTRRDGQERQAPVLVPDCGGEWERVQLAFELRAGGATYAEVARSCRLPGSRRAYARMFRRSLYVGRLQYGHLDIPDWIEPCVSQEVWDAVQIQNEQPSRPRLETAGYPLSGLVRCGECGGGLVGKTVRLRRWGRFYEYRRYQCGRSKNWQCSMRTALHADEIEAALYAVLVREVLTPDALEGLLADARPGRARVEEAQAEVARLEGDLAAVDRAIDRLVEAVDGGAGAVGQLVTQMRKRQAERRQVEAELQETRSRVSDLQPEPVPPEVIRAFCEDMAQVLARGDAVAVRSLLDQVVIEARVWPDGRGEVDYKAPWCGAQGSASFQWE